MAKKIYTWAPNTRLPKAKAQPVGERLNELCGGDWGNLKAQIVLDEAKRPDSPLHDLPCFKDWDVNEAADAFWLSQARYVSSRIQIVDIKQVDPQAKTSGPIRAFFHSERRDKDGRVSDEGHYLPAFRVLNDAEARQRTIDEGLSQVWGILRNLRHFPELARTLAGWRKDAQDYASEGLLARLASEPETRVKPRRRGKKKGGKKGKK